MWTVYGIVISIYLISALAVYVWHKNTIGTSNMSWVGEEEIFLPIYNSIVAITLWKDYNPF
jgi:hypothetical protein